MRICSGANKAVGLVVMVLVAILFSGRALGQGQDSADATKFFTSHGKGVAAKQVGQQLLLANTDVGVEIIQGENGFYLSRIYGIASGQDFLSADSAKGATKLWKLNMRRDKGRDEKGITVSSLDGGQLSSKIDSSDSQVTVHLFWKNVSVEGEPDLIDVEATVTLKKGDPLSRWRIKVTNRSKVYGLWQVGYPGMHLAPIGAGSKTNYFTIPKSRGVLTPDPFNAHRGFGVGSHRGNQWPGSFNMQFQSLYDDQGVGLYLATEDGQGYRKKFYIDQDFDKQIIKYLIWHCPDNMGYPAEDFETKYDVCVGPFSGDWYDACQIYRKWALKQKWCRFGPLRTRENMPKWYKEAPLSIKRATNSTDKAVIGSRDAVLKILDFIGMDLPIAWYSWQEFVPEKSSCSAEGCIDRVPQGRARPSTNVHNGIYPLMPAKPSFASVCKELLEAGGHVMPFVPAKLYDYGLNENAPFAAEAKPNALLTLQGKRRGYHKWLWAMCYHTSWWQNRLKDEILALLANENAAGMYFDTLYGGYYQCFDTRHGHSHGGGNAMYLAASKLSEVVWGSMKKANPQAVADGEKCAETAIDMLDGQLLYWPVWPRMAPLLATVYGDYTSRSGNILIPSSDGFYVQAAAMFTAGGKMGRLHSFHPDKMKKMNFLRKLCHYWKPQAGARFLAYGQYMRPIKFAKPDSMPTFSYNETSRYVRGYLKGLITVPALMNGVFKTHDGDLGVFIVNVTDKPVKFGFELTEDRYPISKSASYAVTAIDNTGKRATSKLHSGKIAYNGTLAGYDVLFLEVIEQ